MNTNTTTTPPTPTDPKERTSHRKTIFSLISITLLLSFLVVGFGQGAVHDNSPVSKDKKHTRPGDRFHYVRCSSDTQYLGGVNVEGWNLLHAENDPKDLQACAARYGPSATCSFNLLNDSWTN